MPDGVNAIELLPGWRTTEGNHMAALRISLKDGWKTYWRVPGTSGIPPTFQWDGSRNIASVQVHWPAPKVYMQDGIQTIGYKGDVVLPLEFKPIDASRDIAVNAQVDLGVCSDVCIPVTSQMQADLTVDSVAFRDVINVALAAQPFSAKAGGVQSVSCKIEPGSDGLNITADILFNKPAPYVQQTVIEYPLANSWVEQTGFNTSGKTMQATAQLIVYSDDAPKLNPDKLRLTLIGKTETIDVSGCPIVPG